MAGIGRYIKRQNPLKGRLKRFQTAFFMPARFAKKKQRLTTTYSILSV